MLHQWIAVALPGGLLERQTQMNSVTIIGTGPIAHGLAVRMLHARCEVTIMGDDQKVQALVSVLGTEARGAHYGSPIEGTIIMLALSYPDIEPFVLKYGPQLRGKIVVDVSNPVDTASFDRMLVPPGHSAAEHLSGLLGDQTPVVKAFNTIPAAALQAGTVGGLPLDVFIAGDSDGAKAAVGRLAASAGMHPIDCGPLRRARELEGIMLIILGLQARATDASCTGAALKLLPNLCPAARHSAPLPVSGVLG
ncbi:NADPH-dependent F420 reductase [Arthrobacter agilis]|uniref:NADPH-dependent F420 reductase n=1 Tax=Arthrobacter agilis TaxID=37921 RepID=UPI00278867BB|nr:NAD(P)-binding domain-containing protein [Arthrobacter agilis]MDQ0735084.1 putative dinucleotide-binding enzyme [Arthrobacter agilis]